MSELITISKLEAGLSSYDQLEKIISKEQLIKEVGFAVQAVQANDKLQQCDHGSILKSVYNIALTGLSLNPIHKLAALVPKFVKGQWQAVLMPQYQGLVKLLTDTGSVTNAYAYCVYEGDEFEYSLGLNIDLIHKPKKKTKNITNAYAVAKLHDGKFQIEVMDKEELDYIRGLSDTWKAYEAKKIEAKNVIWLNFPDEMCRKTVLKRLCKYLPKTDRWDKLNQAIDIDNSEYQVSEGREDYLIRLLETSSYQNSEEHAMIERKIMGGLTVLEYETLKKDLEENQLDPVTSGMNYNQGQLNQHLGKLK